MVLTLDYAHRHRTDATRAVKVRVYHPLGVAGLASLAAIVGAWTAIAVFVGPAFGWQPTAFTTWQFTDANWLLHLVPGAVAIGGGLLVAAMAQGTRRISRSMIRLASFAIISAGAWLVMGPSLWPVFRSSEAFLTGVSASTDFINQIGASFGPGLLLVALGAMILGTGGSAAAVARVADGESPVKARTEPAAVAARPAGSSHAAKTTSSPSETMRLQSQSVTGTMPSDT